MSNDFKEGIPSTSLEALIAAQTRHADEEHFSSIKALKTRLYAMVTQGIPSEVLDLIEALDTPPDEAVSLLTQTYENGATSSKFLAKFWEQQGETALSLQAISSAEADRRHAQLIETGKVTVQDELQARREQRVELGNPENYYTNLITKPLFRKESNSTIKRQA